MLGAKKPRKRPYVLGLFVPWIVLTISGIVWVTYPHRINGNILALIFEDLYHVRTVLVVVWMVAEITMVLMMCVTLLELPKLLRRILTYQQYFVCTCLLIILVVLVTRYPSIGKDEAFLLNAMDDYGKDESVTKMWDAIQRELKCCGVFGQLDWKHGTIDAKVPIQCATTNETTAGDRILNGCLFPFFSFKMDAYESLNNDLGLLFFFEILLSLLLECVLASFRASARVVKAGSMDDEEAASFHTLLFPRYPGKLKFRM